MKKILLCLAVSLFSVFSVCAQSSEQLTAIIKSPKATCAQMAYLPALYTNRISEDDSESQAFEALQNDGLFDSELSANSEVTLAQVCYVYAKTLGMKGGLFYTLFPSPRYAFKEFKAKGILPSEADPSMNLSGRDSLDLFNSCLSLVGEAENGGAR